MSINRYAFVQSKINSDEKYRDIFESKNIKSIEHLLTKKYGNIEKISDSFQIATHICRFNDKLTSISAKYYGNPRYWYVIALVNKIPNDFFLEDGKEIYIYFPLEQVINFYNGN